MNMKTRVILLQICLFFFSANDDNEDDFEESGEVFDDAASSASTLPIAQACPNTLSVALRQLNNCSAGDTLSIGSDSKSRGSNKSHSKNQGKRDRGSIMRFVFFKKKPKK